MTKWLLCALLALFTGAASAQSLPVCNWGDMLYKGSSGYQCLPYDNTAGKFLQGVGANGQPVWTFQAPQQFLLPTQATNTVLGNVTGSNASPTPITVSQCLDTIGYDISRPPVPFSIIYKSNVAPNNAWQALQPAPAGWVLKSGGPSHPPYWIAGEGVFSPPTTISLGGVYLHAPVANQFLTGVDSSGNLLAAQFPALTGDVTTSAGEVATTIANNAVTNAKAAQMAAATFKGNPTNATANVQDFTIQSLPLSTPDANLDYVPIYDHATGIIKKVTPALLDSAGAASICYRLEAYGGSSNGVTDNLAAWNAMVTAIGSTSTCIEFSSGRYLFSSTPIITLNGTLQTLKFKGQGQYVTNLYFPNASNGVTINLTHQRQAVHVDGIAFATGYVGTYSGLSLTQTDYLGLFPQSSIKNCSFIGTDSSGNPTTARWGNGIYVDGLSGVIIDTVDVYSQGNPGNGTGVRIHAQVLSSHGTLDTQIVNSRFSFLQYGVSVDGFHQTLMLNNNSFLFNEVGINSSAGGDVYISNNTFNSHQTGVNLTGPSLSGSIVGNYFEISPGTGIFVNNMSGLRIADNLLTDPAGIEAGVYGIWLGSGVTDGIVTGNALNSLSVGVLFSTGAISDLVTSNSFYNNTIAILFSSGANNNNIQSNVYRSNGTNVNNSGTGNVIGGGSP